MIQLTQAGPDITCEYIMVPLPTHQSANESPRQPSPRRRVDMHGGSSRNHSGMHVSHPATVQRQALVSTPVLGPGAWKGINQLVRRRVLFFRPNPL